MFLTKAELRSVVYAYQLDQVTEGDDTIVVMAIDSAIEEVKSYLRPNSQKAWGDGRNVYDADAVFAATGTDRNALILEVCKDMALYRLVRLCNAEIIYEQTKEAYDRAVAWLKQLNRGEVSASLPLLDRGGNGTGGSDTDTTPYPFRFGSRTPFNHE